MKAIAEVENYGGEKRERNNEPGLMKSSSARRWTGGRARRCSLMSRIEVGKILGPRKKDGFLHALTSGLLFQNNNLLIAPDCGLL